MTTTGRCLCGAIQFEFDGEAVETTHRHCEKLSPPDLFARCHISDSPCTIRHCASPADIRTDSALSPGSPFALSVAHAVRRPYRSQRHPGPRGLFAGTLTGPRTCHRPTHACREQLPWFEMLDNLPRYAQGSRGQTLEASYGPREARK